MIIVYVLQSTITDKYYKGMCQNMDTRLKEHNQGKTKSTKSGIPWKVVYTEEHPNREEARKREKYFNSAAGRRFLNTIL